MSLSKVTSTIFWLIEEGVRCFLKDSIPLKTSSRKLVSPVKERGILVMRASCKKKGAWGKGDYRARTKRQGSKQLSNRNTGLETRSSGR